MRVMVTGGGIRVLCLADETATRAFDGVGSPFEVRHVADVQTCVTAVEDEAVGVDCVVVDARHADGLDALDRVRRAQPSLPVVLVASSDDVERRALDAGASDVVRLSPADGLERRADVIVHRVRTAVEHVRTNRRAAETERLSRLVREVTQAVVEASTRSEVEQAVCTHLVDAEVYPYVWCGRLDDSGALVPGAEGGSAPESIPATSTDLGGRGPIARAVERREVVVVQDLTEDPRVTGGRDASDAEFRSVAVVPLRDDDEVFGVLCLYSARPWAFDGGEQALLSELGEAVGHASHAAELRAQYRRFREAVEHAGHSIYITDVDGTIRYVNPAFERTTGYRAEEAIGRDPSILKSGEYGPEFYRRLWGTILGGDVWNGEIVNRRKDGERYYVEQTIAPIMDGGDDIGGFVAVNNDITVLKDKEETLERQNERLGTFADIVSHDIRNPLNVASGRLELARETGERSHLDGVENALSRIDQLLDDLLTLTRTGQHIGEVESVRLSTLAREAWSTVVTEGATLRLEADCVVHADRSRLRQALENLFRNAVEHADPGVTVTVGALDGGFFVEDDGPGIPESERDDVFDSGHTTDRSGTGLGLAIVERIAEAHDWTVAVTEGSAGGARFEFGGVDTRDDGALQSPERER